MVSSFGYRPRWSPDGSKVLFSDALLEGLPGTPTHLYTATVNGGPPQEILADVLRGFEAVRFIRWLPEGKRLSWNGRNLKKTSNFGNGWGLWFVPLEGGEIQGGLPGPEQERQIEEAQIDGASFQEFTPDPAGRGTFFTAISHGVRNVWKHMYSESAARLIRLTTGPGADTTIAVSADGKKLAFTIRTERTRVWSFPFDASHGRITGEGKAISEPGLDASEPALSPHGKKLAFLIERAGKWEIWQKSLEDGSERLLLTNDRGLGVARWTRDGKRLYHYRRDSAKNANTALALPEETAYLLTPGGTEQRVTSPKPMPWGWGISDESPDGQWLLLMCQERPGEGRWRLCLAPASPLPIMEDQARVVLADAHHDIYNASYSPDGRWILFQAVESTAAGISKIGVIDASGGRWTLVPKGSHWDDKPHWSPDGKRIYFLSNRSGFQNVWGIRFDPLVGNLVDEPFRVTSLDSPGLMVKDLAEFSVARDRLVVPITEVSGNIWMLENVDR